MTTRHRVIQGECLSSIAKLHGFGSWRTIYDDPANADFRRVRPNPDVIYPGDVLTIPEKKPKTVVIATGQRHVFVMQRARCLVRIAVQDTQGRAIVGKKFRLTVGAETHEGETKPGGLVEVPIAPDAVEAELLVWSEGEAAPPDQWPCLLGHLDPVEVLSGVQARLNNLGYPCGPVDGEDGAATRAAVRAFQEDQRLPVDGQAGERVQVALRQAYGI